MSPRVAPPAPAPPEFRPPPGLSHPWVQTIAAQLWPFGAAGRSTVRKARGPGSIHSVPVEAGHALAITLHEAKSVSERDPAFVPQSVIVVHGLGGDQDSIYVRRLSATLHAQGHRVIRFNMRGCGPGRALSSAMFHSGRSGDVAAVLSWVFSRYPQDEIAIVGFSLGGNLVLKMAAEFAQSKIAPQIPVAPRILAICPPTDLVSSAEHLRRGPARVFDQFFVLLLKRHATRLHRQFPELGRLPRWPRYMNIWDFDELYTAPRCGFQSARDYYEQASCGPRLQAISIPTTIMWAQDDPIVDVSAIESFPVSAAVKHHKIQHGGHVGFFNPFAPDPGPCWIDRYVSHWLQQSKGIEPGH